MPSRKQEKRRRKLRVHGPSADAVGAPPTGRKPPREDAPAARTQRRAAASRPCPRSSAPPARARSWAIFMLGIVVVTTRGKAPSPLIALVERSR